MQAGLPGWVKLAYGAGAGGWVIIDRVLLTWLYFFYVTAPDADSVAYMAPLVFSVLMLAGRVVDSLADPVIARMSDNHTGRRGRRIPFMAVSGVFYVVVFVALFYPPVAEPSGWNGLYLAVALGIYFILFTVYVGPYLALLADLTPLTKDRIDLSTAKAVATLLGAAVALIGSGLLIEAFGMYGMVWILAALGLVLLYVPVAIPERRWATAQPATLPLVEAVRTTLRNRPFVVALLGINAFWFGFNIVTLNIPLYVTSLLGMGEGAVALFMGAAFGVALLMFPLVNLASKRRGLKAVMVASLFAFAACFPLLYFFGTSPFGLPPLVLGLAVLGFAGIPLAGFFIVPDAIIATVADLEERLSGQRREGMYFGVNGLFLKVNLGISTVVSGALLQVFGDPLGIRLTGPVAAVAVLAGAVVFTRYPEDQIKEDRTALRASEPMC